MSYDQMLSPLLGAGRSAWGWGAQHGGDAVTRQILKCTRWQLEETTNFVTCPYHYYCDSSYPGDYHSAVGALVAVFAVYCFVATLAFTVLDLARSNATSIRGIKRKYLLPSGPILLPLVLLALAKGQRVNDVFPLAQLGPALLLLLQASALAFRNEADGDIRYAVLEASTVSGVLHASLYLDAVVLPYYTGTDALRWSRFSGECATCLCRMEPLVVGGRTVLYRGLSKTALAIIFSLCSRMVCRIYGEERLSAWTRSALEGASWVLVAGDAVYLAGWALAEGAAASVAMYGLVAGLVFLCVFGKVYRFHPYFRGHPFRATPRPIRSQHPPPLAADLDRSSLPPPAPAIPDPTSHLAAAAVAVEMEAVPAAGAHDGQERFDLGVFVGDLALDEDVASDDESLEGLQQELEDCKNDEEVANILANGIKLRDYTKGVENNIRQVELDSIQVITYRCMIRSAA